MRAADENLIFDLQYLTRKKATLKHQPQGGLLQNLFLDRCGVTPLVPFLLKNGTDFKQTPYSVGRLLGLSWYYDHNVSSVKLLLKHEAKFVNLPGRAALAQSRSDA